jgi:hypothetical protein
MSQGGSSSSVLETRHRPTRRGRPRRSPHCHRLAAGGECPERSSGSSRQPRLEQDHDTLT